MTLKTGLGFVKVIENVTIRYNAYDFLLTFHSNHGPMSYHFRDRRRFRSKIAKFSKPLYFVATLNGFPLELGIGAGGQKPRMMRLPGRQRSLTISSASWIECTNVTDRRTDRHRTTAKTALTCIASRGKMRV